MSGRKLLLKNARAVKTKYDGTETSELIQKILRVGSAKFQRELMTLQGAAYVDRYLQLVEFSVPKLSRVDKTGGGDATPINVQFISSSSSGAKESIKQIVPGNDIIDISSIVIDE